jgi:lysophospholipase L1-like esterase
MTPPPTHILPSDPGLQVSGRVDRRDPRRLRFDWSGVTVRARFSGGRLAVLLEDGANDYDAHLDGAPRRIVTVPGQRRYEFPGLGPGEHTLRLVKRTEGYYGVAAFLGLELEPGAGLLPLPAPSPRRIEFLGDSLTAGFGIDTDLRDCPEPELRGYENHDACYAAETARRLGAEHHAIAVSGRGLIRNWGEPGPRSAQPLPWHYPHTLYNEPGLAWDFSAWRPQAVVLFLGTNDISVPELAPTPGEFRQAYHALLDQVRAAHAPGTPWIFCLSREHAEPMAGWVAETVLERRARGDARVRFVALPDGDPEAVGISRHPNARGQRPWTETLSAVLAQTLGWPAVETGQTVAV